MTTLLVAFGLLAASLVAAQPPTRVVLPATVGAIASPLISAPDPTIFVNVGGVTPVRITTIGANFAVAPGNPIQTTVWMRTGTYQTFETTSAGWTQVFSESITWSPVMTQPYAGSAFFVADSATFPDFVVPAGVAGTGLAITLSGATPVQLQYDAANQTQTYQAALPPGFATFAFNFTASATTMKAVPFTTAAPLATGFHEPQLIFDVKVPNAVSISGITATNCNATTPVAGRDTITFTSTVTNTGFEHLTPVQVLETLTPAGLAGVTHTASAVTGCTWQLSLFPVIGAVGPVNTASAQLIAANYAPNVTVAIPYVKLGNFTDSGDTPYITLTTLTGTLAGPYSTVYEARTSVFIPGPTTDSSRVGALLPQAFLGGGGVGEIFIDDVAVFAAGSVQSSLIERLSPTITSDSVFVVGTSVTISHGTTHNIRAIYVVPQNGNGINDFQLEIYARPNPAQGTAALDDTWTLLAPSVDPAAVTYTASPSHYTIPSLCVGGSVTLTTTIAVAADVEVGTQIAQSLSVDGSVVAANSAIISGNVATATCTVRNQYGLTLAKSTSCDVTVPSYWQVEFWQSNDATVTDGATPFWDFDTIYSAAAPDAVSDHLEVVNFGPANSGFVQGGETTFATLAGGATPQHFFARVTGRIYIAAAGLYTFATLSDRGVRLTIDGRVAVLREDVIPDPNAAPLNGVQNFYTVQLAKGVHSVVVVHYDRLQDSILELLVAPGAEALAPLSDTPNLGNAGSFELTYALLETAPACFLQCNEEFFSGFDVKMWPSTSSVLNDGVSPFVDFDTNVASSSPTATLCDVRFVNFEQSGNVLASFGGNAADQFGNDLAYPIANANNFFFQATGQFYIAQAGVYTLAVLSNRGARLTIDGQVLILNEPVATGSYQKVVSPFLGVGLHSVQVDHYDTLAASYLELAIRPGGASLGSDPLTDSLANQFRLLDSALECQIGTAAETVTAGQPFTYSIIVTNNGPSYATEINVTDAISGPQVTNGNIAQTAVRTEFAADSFDLVNNVWTIRNMPANSQRRLYIDFSVNSLTPASTNSLAVCNALSAVAVPAAEQVPAGSPITVCENVTRLVDLAFTASRSAAVIVAGGASATLSVTVTNNGPSATSGFTIVPVLSYALSDAGITTSATTTTSGPLAVGASFTYTVTLTAASSALSVNTATLSVAGATLTNPLERLIRTCADSASASLNIERRSDIALTKSVAPDAGCITAGDAPNNALTYTLSVHNEGPSDLSGLVLVDTLGNDRTETLGLELTGIQINEQLVAGNVTFVSHVCGLVATTKWNVAFYDVGASVITTGSPFENLDTLRAAGLAPNATETYDRLNFFTGTAPPPSPAFASPASVNYPGALADLTSLFVSATTTIDVRTSGYFILGFVTNTGLRVVVDGETKIVLQPADAQYTSTYTLWLDGPRLHTVTIEFYDGAAPESLLQVLVAHGKVTDSVPFSTPYFAFLEPAVCLFGCDAFPAETQWRVAQWSLTDAATDAALSPFENLDRIIESGNAPAATATAAVIDFPVTSTLPLTSNFFTNVRGQIWISIAGTYTFQAVRPQNGGVRLIVDGKTIMADGQTPLLNTVTTVQYTLALTPGQHDVTFGGYATCTLAAVTCAFTLSIEPFGASALVPVRTSNHCQVPTWTLGALPFNATATLTLPITVLASAHIGSLTNRVHYARTITPTETLIDEYDGDDERGVATCITRRSALRVLAARVGANTPVLAGANSTAGGLAQYVLTVVNDGPSDTAGANIAVTLALPKPTDEETDTDALNYDGVNLSENEGNSFTTLLTNVNYNWLTGIVAANGQSTATVDILGESSAPCDATLTVTDTYQTQVDAREAVTAAPSTATVSTAVVRQSTLTVSAITAPASVVAANTDNCFDVSVDVSNDDRASDLANGYVVLSLGLPLGVTVSAVDINRGDGFAPATFGPFGVGSTLRVNTGRLEEEEPEVEGEGVIAGDLVTVRLTLCTSSETPTTQVITIGATAVTAGCESVAAASVSTTVSVTRNSALVLTNVATETSAIAASHAGNAPFALSVRNGGQSDAKDVVLNATLTTSGLGAAADVHRLLTGRVDVGWTVRTFVSNAALVPATVFANFAATTSALGEFNAELYNTLGQTIVSLGNVGVASNFVAQATAPFIVASGSHAFGVRLLNGGSFELYIDGALVASGAADATVSVTLVAGQHYAEVRYVQGANALAPATLPTVTIGGSAALLGEMPTAVSVLQVSESNSQFQITWTLPCVRASQLATLQTLYSALDQGTDASPTVNSHFSYISSSPTSAAVTPQAANIPIVVSCDVTGPNQVLFLEVVAPLTAIAPSINTPHYIVLHNRGPSRCSGVSITYTTSTGTGITGPASGTISLGVAAGATTTSGALLFNIIESAAVGATFSTTAHFTSQAATVTGTTSVIKEATLSLTAVRVSGTQSNEVAVKGSTVTFTAIVTNNGPSTVRDVQLVFANTPTSAELVVAATQSSTDAALLAGESLEFTFSVAIASTTSITEFVSLISVQRNAADAFAALPAPIRFVTKVAPFKLGLHLTAFEDGASASDSGNDDESSGDSSDSSDRTRLIFVEVANTAAELRAKGVKITVAVSHVHLAEALLTQSSRDDAVVNAGSGSFHWTVAKLEHGQRSRIALKVRGPAHVTVSAVVDTSKACFPSSASCEIDADLGNVLPLSKQF